MNRQPIFIGYVLLFVLAFLPQAVRAQGGQLAENLLRGFLETQLKNERQQAVEREQQRYPQSNSANPRAPQRPAVIPQFQSYHASLRAFAEEADALAYNLQQSAARVRGVRPLLPDMLKLKTTAAIMYDQSAQTDHLSVLRDEYRNLDYQWRNLSFQLQQLRGLDPATIHYIRSLDRRGDQFVKFFGLRPQFDRNTVFRLTVQTEAHLRSLQDNIQYDLYGLEGTASLLGDCRGFVERCRRLSDFANQASYDDLTTKYTSFVTDWRKFAAKLYRYEHAHCARCLRRIRSSQQQVFEQLRLPLAIDRVYLSYVSDRMTREVNLLFENMNVNTLVQLPPEQQQTVLTTARELYTNCQQFSERVDRDSPLDELISAYLEIDNQWGLLDRNLSSLSDSPVVTSRLAISAYDQDIRNLLRVPEQVNREHAVQLAASLEELANHFRYDVRRYGRYYRNGAFRDQAYRASDTFYSNSKGLHATLQTSSDQNQLQAHSRRTVSSWESFSQVINAMPQNGLTNNRYQFFDLSRQEVLPVIAELAALLGT